MDNNLASKNGNGKRKWSAAILAVLFLTISGAASGWKASTALAAGNEEELFANERMEEAESASHAVPETSAESEESSKETLEVSGTEDKFIENETEDFQEEKEERESVKGEEDESESVENEGESYQEEKGEKESVEENLEESGKEDETVEQEDSGKDIVPLETTKEDETLETGERDNEIPGQNREELPDGVREHWKTKKLEDTAVEAIVPIFNYDIVDVIAPAAYKVALNPYEMTVKTWDGDVVTDQVISREYGIINKSSTDKIVTITLVVEDLNSDKIVFVDSAEKARDAGADVFAIYLAVVPAGESEVLADGNEVNEDTTAEELSNVSMVEAMDHAIALHSGENQIAFKLSKADYSFELRESPLSEDQDDGIQADFFEFVSLAPDGAGVTAFTFDGAMNPCADWGKLVNGIRLSAVYTYKTADGTEEIVEGTGSLIKDVQS